MRVFFLLEKLVFLKMHDKNKGRKYQYVRFEIVFLKSEAHFLS